MDDSSDAEAAATASLSFSSHSSIESFLRSAPPQCTRYRNERQRQQTEIHTPRHRQRRRQDRSLSSISDDPARSLAFFSLAALALYSMVIGDDISFSSITSTIGDADPRTAGTESLSGAKLAPDKSRDGQRIEVGSDDINSRGGLPTDLRWRAASLFGDNVLGERLLKSDDAVTMAEKRSLLRADEPSYVKLCRSALSSPSTSLSLFSSSSLSRPLKTTTTRVAENESKEEKHDDVEDSATSSAHPSSSSSWMTRELAGEGFGLRTREFHAASSTAAIATGLVSESSEFCNDGTRPYRSVMTVFASIAVAEAFGLKYSSGCDTSPASYGGGDGTLPRSSSTSSSVAFEPSSDYASSSSSFPSYDKGGRVTTTIQQAFSPSDWPLLGSRSFGFVGVETLNEFRSALAEGCARTVRAWDAGVDLGPEEILLSHAASPVSSSSSSSSSSIPIAVVDGEQVRFGAPTAKEDVAATSSIPAATVLRELFPGLASALLAGIEKWRRAKSSSTSHFDSSAGAPAATPLRGLRDQSSPPETAVIYLSCLDDACSSSASSLDGGNIAIMLPAYYYAHRILPSVSRIHVLASTSCVDNVPGCFRHGEALRDELARLYPRADATFEVAHSTADLYSRMMDAKYLMCPPSVGCLLPALARNGYDSTWGAEVTIMDDHTAYPWFRPLKDRYSPWIGLIDSGAFPTDVVGKTDADPMIFLRDRPGKGKKICRLLRGRSGRWVRNMEYARKAQYVSPLKRYRSTKFIATDDAPYPSGSSYWWEDDLCPVSFVDRQGMCETLEKVSVSRIMIVGDSLSLQFAKALWKLLGHEDDPDLDRKTTPDWKPWMKYRWSRTVSCYDNFSEGGRSFTVQFVRNDLLNGETRNIDSFHEWGEDHNCGTYSYCFPWMEDYSNYDTPGRTLLVANLGSHLHSLKDFRSAFDAFASNLERVQRPGDFAFIRTTVPGHEGCQDSAVRPLEGHDDFQRTLVEDYKSWHLFGEYNDHVHRAAREWAVRRSFHGRSFPMAEVFDVYPMTVLRPDGHEGGPEGCTRCKIEDCLHYALPGPPDFWVHMMYSHLLDWGNSNI